MVCQTNGRSVQCRITAGRQQEQLRDPRRRPLDARRRLFQHGVGVGATDAEGTHAGPSRDPSRCFPHAGCSTGNKRAVLELERRIRCREVDERRQHPILQRQHRLDQPCHASRCIEVAEVGLQRAEAAEGLIAGTGTKRARQCRDLNRVTERRGSAVCFDVADAARRHLGERLCRCDHLDLTVDTGGRVAGLAGTVVVHGNTANHGMDGVAVSQGVVEALEHDDPGASAGARAASIDIERPALAVRR